MDSNTRIIPLHLHPLGFIESFVQFGAPLPALLQQTGIELHMLDSPTAKISYNQQLRLLHNGISLCHTPGLGLLVGMNWDWAFHGTVGFVTQCSPSLREAGEAFHRFSMIAQPYYMVSVAKPLGYVDANDTYVLPIRCFQTSDAPAEMVQFELEFRLAMSLRLWDACGNKKVARPDVHVELAQPEPRHAALYRQLPCKSVTFGCTESRIAAHQQFYSEPFRPYRRALFEQLIARCEEELRLTGLQISTAAAVHMHIRSHFSRQLQFPASPDRIYRPVSLEDTAQALHMTPRTLARRLTDENTSFRRIQHDFRIEATLYHLKASRLGVEEIAELMGFSCASSMRRAVKVAIGETIGVARSK
ncbi:AraC-type DNA-binding protein [Halopseudomonas xinjiangensis]|uniref:AraC-type DNA-binding protein n=1 Tax=Halopseudomonas xinjiangensis TaxID=487184 RepID=A0A1H1L6X6_9GAMM|nr:AraC family transcriptional regulator ligand-binding domain-containing protein [Halopseudomonas xinjiangensis]SDR70223.1 AraC-type DNA-binding protein [Halopseudomonas xinjiangensis]